MHNCDILWIQINKKLRIASYSVRRFSIFVGRLKDTDNLEDQGTDGRIISKWSSKKQREGANYFN